MNSKWLKILFVISLVLNCMVAGALTYKYFFEEPRIKPLKETSEQIIAPIDFPQRIRDERRSFQRRMRQERMRIQKEQDRLVDFLMQDPLDRREIHRTLEQLHKVQGEVQQLVLQQILKEVLNLSPEQKALYLSNIKMGMVRKGMFGMGRRRYKDKSHPNIEGQGRENRLGIEKGQPNDKGNRSNKERKEGRNFFYE
jgi:uncharacterized membrane protein